MTNSIKYIVTYATIFSLLFSSFGITIYYHNCKEEQKTFSSITGKIQCNTSEPATHNNDVDVCCNNDNHSHKHCNHRSKTQSPKPHLIIDEVSCCSDNQVTNKIADDFVGNSKQKITKKKLQNNFEKPSSFYNKIIKKINEDLNKKIINPIKKLISLIQQIYKIINSSDKDNDEDSSLY